MKQIFTTDRNTLAVNGFCNMFTVACSTMTSRVSALFQPYPAYTDPRRQAFQCLATGSTVFCMLYFLKPFNLNLVDDGLKARYAFVYALIALVVTIIYTVILPRLIPKWYDERRWVVYKEILNISLLLLTISLFNMLAQYWLDGDQISLRGFFKTLTYILPIAAFPVSLAIVLKQRVLFRKYRQTGADLDTLLHRKQPVAHQGPGQADSMPMNAAPLPSKLVLTGMNEGEVLELDMDAFRYIRSEDNYAKVFWIEQGMPKSRILRNTLKNLEEKTLPFAQVKRCHRGYIVNLGTLEKIVGDAQGLKIKLAGIPEDIPVGKKYLELIRDMASGLS